MGTFKYGNIHRGKTCWCDFSTKYSEPIHHFLTLEEDLTSHNNLLQYMVNKGCCIFLNCWTLQSNLDKYSLPKPITIQNLNGDSLYPSPFFFFLLETALQIAGFYHHFSEAQICSLNTIKCCLILSLIYIYISRISVGWCWLSIAHIKSFSFHSFSLHQGGF